MRRLYPDPATELDPLAIYDDLAFPAPPRDRPYVALNMVTSVDGKAAVGEAAAPLGSTVDHQLMRALRAAHDAVLHGAATLRAERIDPRAGATWRARRLARGQRPEPLAVLLTTRGDLPLDRRYFAYPEVERLIVAGTGLSAERRATLAGHARLLLAPTPAPEPAWVLDALYAAFGVRHLLVEGGPRINGALLAAGLVDELFWTVAPKLAGGGERLTMVEGPPLAGLVRLTLLAVYLHEDELFLRYRLRDAS